MLQATARRFGPYPGRGRRSAPPSTQRPPPPEPRRHSGALSSLLRPLEDDRFYFRKEPELDIRRRAGVVKFDEPLQRTAGVDVARQFFCVEAHDVPRWTDVVGTERPLVDGRRDPLTHLQHRALEAFRHAQPAYPIA